MNTKMKKGCSSAILYHYPCPDGVFAALAAHLYFKATSLFSPPLFFPNTVYSPLRVQDLPLNQISDLYLLDFVGPPGFVHQISTKVPRVIILDHHKTALESLCSEDTSLGENVIKVIDMERSGATIAFDYFKEKLVNPDVGVVVNQPSVLGEFERARQLFQYIEDVDLWRWRLQNSKAFSSGLKDLKIEFDARINPSLFDQLLSLDLDKVISQGMVSLSHKQKLIDECLSKSYEIALGNGAYGHCLAVNADATLSELRSELGHQLATKSQKLKLSSYKLSAFRTEPLRKVATLLDTTSVKLSLSIVDHGKYWGIGAVVYNVPELENDQKLKISLRSMDNEDTTPISQEFGGGGHRNASSFMLKSEEFEQWKVSHVVS